MATVGLSLIAACLWGAADFRGGVLSRRIPALTVLLVVETVGLGGALLAVALSGASTSGLDSLAWAFGAGIAGALGLVTLYRAMALGKISIVAPISACGAGLPVVVGLVSGERPGPIPLAGIVLGLAGCALAAREQDADGDSGQARTAIVLAMLATIGIGIYLTGMHYATDESAIWWPLLVSRLGSVAVALAALSQRRTLPGRSDLPALALVGAGDFGGSLAYAGATSYGLLTLAAVLASLYPVVSVLLARLTLGERLLRIQLAGVVLALGGACLMATY